MTLQLNVLDPRIINVPREFAGLDSPAYLFELSLRIYYVRF